MGKKAFDVDAFIDSLADDEPDFIDDEARFRECPRCGSEAWEHLITNKAGRVVKCTDCEGEDEQ